MRFSLVLILIFSSGVLAQSGRASATAAIKGPETSSTPSGDEATVKSLFDEVNRYLNTKFIEFQEKKIAYSDTLLEQTKREQRQLAAKYAASATKRTNLAGEDLYYLGMLHWIAENWEGTAENLGKFAADEAASAERRQTARSVMIVALAKRRKLPEAEVVAAEYIRSTPQKLTERARFEAELAKAYKTQKDFAKMAPHAEEAYKASRELLKDAESRSRGLDEILDAAMLVFEAYRDLGDRSKADDALENMRRTASGVQSPSFYYYAVDQKIKYLIETGRKEKATTYYESALANAGRDFQLQSQQKEIEARLRKRQQHYKLLGTPAPELPMIDAWFPGQRRTLAELKGKVVLLDFWATWCGPCYGTFPLLSELHDELSDEGLVVLGLTKYYGNANGVPADRPAEIAFLKDFRKTEKLTYDIVVADGADIQLLYGGTSLPTAVLIDRKGMIRYLESGTSPLRHEELREMTARLLAEK